MRRAQSFSIVISAAAIAALSACEPEVVGPEVAAEDLCGAIARAVCSADATCCAASPEGCVESQTEACRSALQPLVDDPRLAYDPRRGGELVESVRVSADSCGAQPVDPDALVAAFAGTGARGADCTPQDTRPASLRISALSCARGLSCRLYLRADGSTEGECAPRDGDACSHALDCAPGTFCALPDAWEPGVWGTCRPLRADGWECASDLECQSRHCDGTCGAPSETERCLEVGYSDVVLEGAPLVFLRFDETSGTRADDATGNARSGTLTSTAMRDPHGAIAIDDEVDPGVADGGAADGGATGSAEDGGAVRFAGDDAAVRISSIDALDDASAMSLEAWFRADDVGTIRPILEMSDGTDLGPHIWQFETGDRIYASFVDEAGEGQSVMSSEGAISVGTWHHVVATWDGTKARLYLDGRRVAEADAARAPRLSGDLLVGHRATGEMPTSFRGSIDEVAVYDRALEAAEIARHHDTGAAGRLENRFPLFRWVAP